MSCSAVCKEFSFKTCVLLVVLPAENADENDGQFVIALQIARKLSLCDNCGHENTNER